jgi:hypothetical protein
MGNWMMYFNPEDYNIPRLVMGLKRNVYPGLSNIYVELIKRKDKQIYVRMRN